MTIIALLLALCGGARAAEVAPELAPGRSVFPSPFYNYFKEPAPLEAAAAPVNAEPAALAPRVAAVSQAPVLAASAIPAARAQFPAAVDSLQARREMTPDQRALVSGVARRAFEAKDVDTLAQLALLTSREKERALHDLLLEALNVMKNRILTPEQQDAVVALRTLSSTEPLTDASRAWISDQVKARVAARHLALPAQLELPLGR